VPDAEPARDRATDQALQAGVVQSPVLGVEGERALVHESGVRGLGRARGSPALEVPERVPVLGWRVSPPIIPANPAHRRPEPAHDSIPASVVKPGVHVWQLTVSLHSPRLVGQRG